MEPIASSKESSRFLDKWGHPSYGKHMMLTVRQPPTPRTIRAMWKARRGKQEEVQDLKVEHLPLIISKHRRILLGLSYLLHCKWVDYSH